MRIDDDTIILRDHAVVLAQHYLRELRRLFPSMKDTVRSRESMLSFIGVSPQTLNAWFLGQSSSPKGETLLKLMCWLEAAGYQIIELSRYKPTMANYARLIGYGILSVQAAAKALGEGVRPSNLYQILDGRDGTSEEKKAKMMEVYTKQREELVEKMEQTKKLARLLNQVPQAVSLETSAATAPKIRGVFHLMQGLSQLLDEFTPYGLSADEQAATLQLQGRLAQLTSSPSKEEA